MSKAKDPADPKGLIREAYRIEGIRIEECRTIFLDWALSIGDLAPAQAIPQLLDRYRSEPDDHPMSQTLREGLAAPARTGRRGGRSGRRPA